MKPLNYKERNDKFFYFVIAGVITLAVTIFCFYFTNYFLGNAISANKVERYSRFQQYRRNQQRYSKQLDQINKSLTGSFSGNMLSARLISDFRLNFTKNGDTSLLMTRIVQLSNRDAELLDQKYQSDGTVRGLQRELKQCTDQLKNNNKTK